MPVISRRISDSNPTRRTALKAAKTKRDNSSLAADVLRASTASRLDAIALNYANAYQAVDDAQVDSAIANASKDLAQTSLFLYASHYIMVMNLAIKRGEIPVQHRAYYELDINSDALPYMGSEQALKQVGENIVQGDTKRIAAGGVPMTNPTAEQVKTKLKDFTLALIAASERTDTLDTKKEFLDSLNTEADEVILRVWDEVESYFNNEPIESKRANAREWGVVYVSTGLSTTLYLTVLLPGGAPAVEYVVKLQEGKGSHITDAEGKVDVNTTLFGDLTLQVARNTTDEPIFTQAIKVTEGQPFTGVLQLV